jgi:hypothetical protein
MKAENVKDKWRLKSGESAEPVKMAEMNQNRRAGIGGESAAIDGERLGEESSAEAGEMAWRNVNGCHRSSGSMQPAGGENGWQRKSAKAKMTWQSGWRKKWAGELGVIENE